MGRGSAARRNGLILAAAGLALLLGWTAVSFLSHRFVFGEGHDERPIVAFLGLYGMCWLAFAAGYRVMRRSLPGWAPPFILLTAVAARAVLLPSHLIQENDCYRYVLDGMAVRHGVNPFAYTPEDIAAAPYSLPPFVRSGGEMEQRLSALPDTFRVSLQGDDARRVLRRISYRDVPTIYPPLAQAAFALGSWLTPWETRGMRYVFLACDLATLGLLLLWLRYAGLPLAWSLLYAWNPLVIKEIANSAHLESLAGLCLAAAAFATVWSVRGGWARALPAGALWAAAALAKLYPVLLLPAVFAWYGRRWRHQAAWLASSAAVVILGFLPFLDVGVERLTEGLRTYGAHWLKNAGAFALIDAALPHPRLWAAGVTVAAALAGAAYVARGGKDESGRLAAAMQWTLVIWLLVMPAVYPWYAVGLVALSVLRPRWWLVVLSGALALYYVRFLVPYREWDPRAGLAARIVEHGVLWLVPIWSAAAARVSAMGRTSTH